MTDQLNPRFRFDAYVVGTANRLAVTAAKAVAESPGSAYNPLFVYGGPGLGKTHLLMAVGHFARGIDASLTVDYITCDDFVEAFHAAIGAGQGDAYRRRYAETGLLLLDDVQFLTHRREVQAELLRLVDQMTAAGRQIVMSSDRPPSEIEALDERLIQRFAGGLVIDISAPDLETRIAILRRQAEERNQQIDPGVLEVVATIIDSNVRELIGGLNRLIAWQSVSDRPIDPDTAREVLDGGPTIMRWEGEGFRTARLSALLEQESPGDPLAAIQKYEADVARLRALEAEAVELEPQLAGSAAFRDPDDLAGAIALSERARAGSNPPPGPSPIFRLEEFVEGPSNRIAVRAAHGVVEEPATKYNPFVIVAVSGLGKTHLLQAIANKFAGREGAVVACLGAQDFTQELIEAIERDRVAVWRARYRRVTALCIDDIHLLQGKDRTQEELFWLFDQLLGQHRQLVFSSAVPVRDLTGLEERLRSRLEGGLVVTLGAPERELRLGVVERALHERLGTSDPELAAYLAGRPAESLRAVLGLVQRLLGASEAQNVAPSAGLAREVLEGPLAGAERKSGATRRSSGIVVTTSGGVKSAEKMVWDWPDLADRLMEDLR
ncbi:MAG: ATP-binding protein [Gemmatimonadetes bacterium]|nr:ATP-binding protein [Gemmatimonadota bacterium]